jgi:hypothetical protein
MAADIVIATSVVATLLGALGVFFARLGIKHCRSCCCESDCMSPPTSPRDSIASKDIKIPRRGLSKIISDVFNRKIKEVDLPTLQKEDTKN